MLNSFSCHKNGHKARVFIFWILLNNTSSSQNFVMLWFGLCIQYDSIQNLNGFIYSVPALFLLIREIEKKIWKWQVVTLTDYFWVCWKTNWFILERLLFIFWMKIRKPRLFFSCFILYHSRNVQCVWSEFIFLILFFKTAICFSANFVLILREQPN